jgi:hypothetical protein
MSTLELLGVTTTRSRSTATVEVNGSVVSRKETTRITATLPRPSRVRASFSKEGLVEKVVKLFKSELQAGDAEFDAAVYVSTDTPEVTKSFLQDAELRVVLARLVEHGGVELDGTAVVASFPEHFDFDPPELVTLMAAALR